MGDAIDFSRVCISSNASSSSRLSVILHHLHRLAAAVNARCHGLRSPHIFLYGVLADSLKLIVASVLLYSLVPVSYNDVRAAEADVSFSVLSLDSSHRMISHSNHT